MMAVLVCRPILAGPGVADVQRAGKQEHTEPGMGFPGMYEANAPCEEWGVAYLIKCTSIALPPVLEHPS